MASSSPSSLFTFGLLSLGLFGFAGCGGSLDTTPGADGGSDTAVSDTGAGDTTPPPTDGGGSDTNPPPTDGGGSGCPAAIPTPGTACAPNGLVCDFGDDPRPSCRPHANCVGGTWEVPLGACPPPPTDTCPASATDAAGKSCSKVGAFCIYGDVTCGCGNCFGGPCGTEARWVCDAPPTNPDCPKTVPHLGASCAKEGVSCSYGTCGGGTIAGRVCKGSVWVDEPQACPL